MREPERDASVYNYFRDYDAVTGRYVQSDPIGLSGGLNPFSCVDGNPLTKTDPYGLSACADLVKALVAIWANSFSSTELGSEMLSRRNTTLSTFDGFRSELVAGGQGGAVSRHVYGHAGVVLAYPYGPGLAGSYANQWLDRAQRYQRGRTKDESSAEIAGDRAARRVAEALDDAMEARADLEKGACIDTSSMSSDLRAKLMGILCRF